MGLPPSSLTGCTTAWAGGSFFSGFGCAPSWGWAVLASTLTALERPRPPRRDRELRRSFSPSPVSAFASGAPGNVLDAIPEGIVNKDILNKINRLYATTEIPEEELVKMIYAEGGDEADEYAARKLLFSIDPYTAKFGTPYWRTHPDYEGFRRLLKYSKYMHGKFYYMDENCECPGIDYENYVRIMKEENYGGYIASEYEGTDPDDTEQIKRHIAMLDKYWAKY